MSTTVTVGGTNELVTENNLYGFDFVNTSAQFYGDQNLVPLLPVAEITTTSTIDDLEALFRDIDDFVGSNVTVGYDGFSNSQTYYSQGSLVYQQQVDLNNIMNILSQFPQ